MSAFDPIRYSLSCSRARDFIHVTHTPDGQVLIGREGHSMSWTSFTPAQARALATLLLEYADLCDALNVGENNG